MIKYLCMSAVLVSLVGCELQALDDSTYVLVRESNFSAKPAARAYFMDDDAQLNGMGCREVMTLANEAVSTRLANGETLTPYQCVSLREARERGFK